MTISYRAIVLSVIAIFVSVFSLVFPFLNADFRRTFVLTKYMSKSNQYRKSLKSPVYPLTYINLGWLHTVYHVKPEIVNKGTASIRSCFIRNTEVRRDTLYVILKDYMGAGGFDYKLLIEDPTDSIWTEPIEIDRDFLEDNYDKLIVLDVEITRNIDFEGVVAFDRNKSAQFRFNPISVRATNEHREVYQY